jgi:hypothetical protein
MKEYKKCEAYILSLKIIPCNLCFRHLYNQLRDNVKCVNCNLTNSQRITIGANNDKNISIKSFRTQRIST